MYFIQYCFICRPSESTPVSEDAGIEPKIIRIKDTTPTCGILPIYPLPFFKNSPLFLTVRAWDKAKYA
jgi:hypothetical protein